MSTLLSFLVLDSPTYLSSKPLKQIKIDLIIWHQLCRLYIYITSDQLYNFYGVAEDTSACMQDLIHKGMWSTTKYIITSFSGRSSLSWYTGHGSLEKQCWKRLYIKEMFRLVYRLDQLVVQPVQWCLSTNRRAKNPVVIQWWLSLSSVYPGIPNK